MKFFLVFAPIITGMLLVTTYSNDNRFDQLQALAQPIDVGANNTNSLTTTENKSNAPAATPGQTIFYRG